MNFPPPIGILCLYRILTGNEATIGMRKIFSAPSHHVDISNQVIFLKKIWMKIPSLFRLNYIETHANSWFIFLLIWFSLFHLHLYHLVLLLYPLTVSFSSILHSSSLSLLSSSFAFFLLHIILSFSSS